MSKIKKLLSLLLCLVMVVSLFPAAFAEDGEITAVPAEEETDEGRIALVPEEEEPEDAEAGLPGEDDSPVPVGATVYDGRTYERYDLQLTWTEAESFCEQRGGHLVTITEEGEQQAVLALLSGSALDWYWIGCSAPARSDAWSWVTGEDFSFENLVKDAPELSESEETVFAAILAGSRFENRQAGEWIETENGGSALYSLANAGFICEYEYAEGIAAIELPGGDASPAALSPNALSITTQPKSVTAYKDTTAKFTVAASGTSLSYQWQWRKNSSGTWADSTATGAKTTTLSITAAESRNGYQYRCKVSNASAAVYSSAATLTVSAKPVITTQPKSVSVVEGSTAKFTVSAVGASSYRWQWRKNSSGTWADCSSATTGYNKATLSVSAAASRNGYQYRCRVKNDAGNTYSSAATLSLQTKPAVTTQPKSVTAYKDTTAKFTVKASGGGISYQWQWRRNSSGTWADSSATGAKTATISVTAAESRSGYQYRCRVKNGVGTAYSSAATLTVTLKPVITTQPKSASVLEGSTAKFTVTAAGASSYRWQWRKNSSGTWADCSSATTGYNTATLSVSATASRNGYQYRCRVKNSEGTVYSSIVTLTVISKPTITTQPKSVSVTKDTTVKFTVKATGGSLSYQWQWRKNSSGTWADSTATGAKTATLSITASESRNGYQYRCRVKNSAGTVYSSIATLTVISMPTITTQPKSVSVTKDTTVKFTVKATGGSLSYQWQWRKNSSGTWADSTATGAKTATLSITASESRNGYQYRCRVKNSVGTVYSTAATLTVKSTTTYRALLIGEVSFDGDTCNRNRGDVIMMRDMLAGIKGPNGGSYQTTCKYDLTVSEVQSAIESTFAGADEDDVSLFFMATHGVTNVSSGYWAGAISTYDGDLIPIPDLAEWLSAVPGKVIVLLGSCGSGAAIYPNGAGTAAFDADAFNECVIDAFAARDTVTNEYLPNLGEFRTSKFYVLTAAQHMESSLGQESSNPYNLFTYVLVEGVEGSMPADTNKNNIVTLSELYTYIESDDTIQYYQAKGYQHTQVYPENSSYALFAKK